MAIRDWSKRKLARLWLAGALVELGLIVLPLLLQPSPEQQRRRETSIRDSVQASLGAAVDLDTLSPARRDSLVTLARQSMGRVVEHVGMTVALMGLVTLGVYLAVPAGLTVITVLWLRHRRAEGNHRIGAGA